MPVVAACQLLKPLDKGLTRQAKVLFVVCDHPFRDEGARGVPYAPPLPPLPGWVFFAVLGQEFWPALDTAHALARAVLASCFDSGTGGNLSGNRLDVFHVGEPVSACALNRA